MTLSLSQIIVNKILKPYKKKNKDKHHYKKRDLMAVGMAVTAALIYVSEYEKKHLTYAQYEVNTHGKIKKDRTIVFLSDMHDDVFGTDNSTLISMIDRVNPDAILIGGDMPTVKDEARLNNTIELCENLTRKYVVYYAEGNHEQRLDQKRVKYGDVYDDFYNQLKDMGVIYLKDETALLDDDIKISGLNIDKPYYANVIHKEMKGQYIRSKLGRADDGYYNILLSHSPLFLDAYADWGADLCLAGHFHGGTIRLPGNMGLMTPQYQFFSDKVVGLKQKGKTSLIISAGLGTHSVNIRFNNKPQIVVVELKK